MLSAEATIPPAIVRSPSGARTRSGLRACTATNTDGHEPAFGVELAVEGDHTTVFLSGELDMDAADLLSTGMRAAFVRPFPVLVNCAALTFADTTGLQLLADTMRSGPRARLVHVSDKVARTLRTAGLRCLLDEQARHTVSIALCAEVSPMDATRVAEVFLHATEEGCTYDLVSAAFEGLDTAPQYCDVLIVPPLRRWMGLADPNPLVSWARALVKSADHVVGIGTGTFLLAAAGALDGHDVVAHTRYADELAAVAPHARVHRGISALRDGAVSTSVAGDAAVMLCMSLVGDHCGTAIKHRLASRFNFFFDAVRHDQQIDWCVS